MRLLVPLLLVVALPALAAVSPTRSPRAATTLSWARNLLTIRNPALPGETIEVHYLEAFCRPGSTDRDWSETVIPHRTTLIEATPDGARLRLVSELADGLRVTHEIRAVDDGVEFRLVAHNPTDQRSQAHWAQPCVRVDRFVGVERRPNSEEYLPKCFVFLDGRLTRMPTPRWATQARYTPGQVWCPRHVDRNDVNPRPLNPDVPSNGLIGCFSSDEKWIFATAWEPYQELFQGVLVCLHSDFRLGGLLPGETKPIRGRIYLVPADVPALLRRYRRDFPEHHAASRGRGAAPRQ